MIRRGEIWWGDLDEPVGSAPGYARPLLIIQSDTVNDSRIATTITLGITTNLRLVGAPGNVLLAKRISGLPKDSVINVSQVYTLDRVLLRDRVSRIPDDILAHVDQGLRFILSL